MPRILILGATGYIGSALASSLLRSNHTVYGLARTPSKANQLARQEIIPVLGSVQDSAAYIALIHTAHIDIVIDCAGANQESATVLSDVRTAGEERLKQKGPKLGFVYTSGTFVHGSSQRRVSDLDPVGTAEANAQPPRLVAWRPQMERDVLSAGDVLHTVVVRPSLVYGREHGVWSSFFGPVLDAAERGEEGVVKVPLRLGSRPALVHVDDVAEGMRCVVEKLPLLAGTGVYPVFDLVTSQESMEDIFRAFAREVGLKGRVELVGAGEDDIFALAMQSDGNLDASRAEQLLGWRPGRRGFVERMAVFAKAFVAAQEKV
ncbi:hypothetical protein IMSHALPRED_007757 [Imshaugia aleurites]|uniref:NAD-dependent epimerase/dehydratase domain-containing protein n=1 Tax=Imshaugia aleurites TaxID=172621 RepID=A0A8H3FW65_9LECA|nr:hypothetical protein IMSHALPRED_007757 [Imshaugia aleurites]